MLERSRAEGQEKAAEGIDTGHMVACYRQPTWLTWHERIDPYEVREIGHRHLVLCASADELIREAKLV